jgi:hypothetical protein
MLRRWSEAVSGRNTMRLSMKLQVGTEAEGAQPRALCKFVPAEGEKH